MFSEIKSMSTQCLFIYHNTKQKSKKKQLHGYLNEKALKTPYKAFNILLL